MKSSKFARPSIGFALLLLPCCLWWIGALSAQDRILERTLAIESDGPLKAVDLEFAAGLWRSEGTQYWSDGKWIQHKGIVEGRLSKDGLSLTRQYWAAFENGHSLAGNGLHQYVPSGRYWVGSWTPTKGRWDATPAVGRMEGEDYVEVARGNDGGGRFISKTRFKNIRANSYDVCADLMYDSGQVSKENWTIRYTRIDPSEPGLPSAHEGSLEFMLGLWHVSGSVIAPDGRKLKHQALAEGKLVPGSGGYERQYWGSLESGEAIRGASLHSTAPEADLWEVLWTPVGSTSPTSKAMGRFELDEFVEREQKQFPEGIGTSVTRYYDFTQNGFRVRTDILFEGGEAKSGVWTADYRRIN